MTPSKTSLHSAGGGTAAVDRHGVALLIVLMLILGLLILGQAAMLLLDQVALRSGTYRRQEVGNYCAEEGLNLGRAWVLQNMQGSTQLNPKILNGTGVGNPGLLSDPSNPNDLSSAAKDLCQLPGAAYTVVPGVTVTTLTGLCPADATSPTGFKYQINLVDDIDEDPSAAAPKNAVDPYTDRNQVFIIRSSCLSGTTTLPVQSLGQGSYNQDVAMVEVNQQGGAGGCYNGAGVGAQNVAGCGGGSPN